MDRQAASEGRDSPHVRDYPAFMLLWTATVVSNLGTQVQSVASAWLMTDIGSMAEVALIQSLISMPLMIFALPGGVLADIFDRWRLITLAYGLMFAAALLAMLSGMAHVMTPLLLLVLCFLFGTGQALFGPTSMAAVGDSVPSALLPNGVAALSVAFNIARCLGPALGGTLVAGVGANATFAANAAMCGIVTLLLVRMLRSRPPRVQVIRPSAFTRLLAEGAAHAVVHRDMRVIACRIFAFATCASPIWALLPLVARDQLRGTALVYGVTMSALGVGALFISFCIRQLRERHGSETVFRWAATMMAIVLLTLPLTANWIIVAAQLVVAGAAWVASLTLFNIAAQSTAPPAMVGRAIGIFYVAIFGGLTLGSAFFGYVVEITSLGTALALSGALVLLTTVISARWPIQARPPSPFTPRHEADRDND